MGVQEKLGELQTHFFWGSRVGDGSRRGGAIVASCTAVCVSKKWEWPKVGVSLYSMANVVRCVNVARRRKHCI